MFHDLEVRGMYWHKELASVLWALRTNVNKATRDTPFNLVYGADAVLPPEIYLGSARVAHLDAERQRARFYSARGKAQHHTHQCAEISGVLEELLQ
jgi:hypothetical protein